LSLLSRSPAKIVRNVLKMSEANIAGSQQQDGKKRIDGPPPQPTLPAVRHAILNSSLGYLRKRARTAENGLAGVLTSVRRGEPPLHRYMVEGVPAISRIISDI